MAGERGNAFVLQIGDGATAEAFTTIGGMRTTSLSINGEIVDVTDKDSGGWRELITGAGVNSISLSFSGVFKDTAAETLLLNYAMAQEVNNYQIVTQGGVTFSCAFQVQNLEYQGDYNGARQYSGTLESAGTLTYV